MEPVQRAYEASGPIPTLGSQAFGVMAALDDGLCPGNVPAITAEADAWPVSLACRKAKDLGYPYELWTMRSGGSGKFWGAPNLCLAI